MLANLREPGIGGEKRVAKKPPVQVDDDAVTAMFVGKIFLMRDVRAHAARGEPCLRFESNVAFPTQNLACAVNVLLRDQQVDVTGVEPTAHAVPLINVTRPDEVRPSLSNEDALRNAPANQQWGGRFAAGPAVVMQDINASIGFDKKLWRQDISGSLAHAAMLVASGIIAPRRTSPTTSKLRPTFADAT